MNAKKLAKGRKPAATTAEGPVVKNGWTIYAHPLLLDQIDRLASGAATKGASSDPAKVLKWLIGAIFEDIPQDPTREAYRQGHTLGKENTHWFRDRYAGRFRLFFRYSLKAKILIFAWVNDEHSLRTYGAKTDAYAVFRDMLDRGNPPRAWEELLQAASTSDSQQRLKGQAPS